MNSRIIYITDCSHAATSPDGTMFCECTRDQIVKKNVKNDYKKPVKLYACKEHGGLLVQRKIICQCGIERYFPKMGKPPRQCEKCQKEESIQRNREAVKKRWEAEKRRREKAKQKNHKVIVKPDQQNILGCLNFHHCGSCIRPWFRCRMFKSEATGRVAA